MSTHQGPNFPFHDISHSYLPLTFTSVLQPSQVPKLSYILPLLMLFSTGTQSLLRHPPELCPSPTALRGPIPAKPRGNSSLPFPPLLYPQQCLPLLSPGPSLYGTKSFLNLSLVLKTLLEPSLQFQWFHTPPEGLCKMLYLEQ